MHQDLQNPRTFSFTNDSQYTVCVCCVLVCVDVHVCVCTCARVCVSLSMWIQCICPTCLQIPDTAILTTIQPGMHVYWMHDGHVGR